MAKLLSKAQRTPTPWKNGGGSTCELAVFPSGAGFADFDWRVSLATIAQSGPFSSFPGVDRSLAPVEGQGLVLTIDGQRVELGGERPLVSFPGEAVVVAEVSSPTTDLNVMTRRGRLRHELSRLTTPVVRQRRAPWSLVFLVEGKALTLRCGEAELVLAHHDAVLLGEEDALGLSLTAPSPTKVLFVELWT